MAAVLLLTVFILSTFQRKCRDKTGVSHCITWRPALRCKRVDISGATAFGVSGLSSVDSFNLFIRTFPYKIFGIILKFQRHCMLSAHVYSY